MTDLIFILGAAAIIAGCALVSTPAALIVGGALAIIFASGLARSEA